MDNWTYMWNKLQQYWSRKNLDGEISEEEYEHQIDILEQMDINELEQECDLIFGRHDFI
jgi:hypothetical protein